MALIEQKVTEDGLIQLTAHIEATAFEEAVSKIYQKKVRTINVQGFRKGKAPRSIIERMYGADFFYEEAINELLPALFDAAVEEAGIEFIGHPNIEISEIGRETGATVEFTVKPRPELAVGTYKGIAGTKTVNTVEESEIDAEVEQLREKASRMVSVEDRPAQEGDTACIDFEGFLNGKPFAGGKGEHYDLTLGSGQFIPGFEEQITGRSPGEEFDVTVTFPEEYNAKELAGKEAVFKVKLNDLSFKETPEADDEFAKDVSEFDTIKELRADLKAKLLAHKDEHSKSDLETQLVEAVAETLQGEIPEEMVESRIEEMTRDFGYRLKSQGLSLDNYLKYTNSNAAAFKESFRERAEKYVRSRLTLEAVARAENIGITEQDIDDEIKRMAEQFDVEPDKITEAMTRREIAADVRVQKAIEVILNNAKVKEEKPKKNTPEKAEG